MDSSILLLLSCFTYIQILFNRKITEVCPKDLRKGFFPVHMLTFYILLSKPSANQHFSSYLCSITSLSFWRFPITSTSFWRFYNNNNVILAFSFPAKIKIFLAHFIISCLYVVKLLLSEEGRNPETCYSDKTVLILIFLPNY